MGSLSTTAPRTSDWTVVIPAAGRGSRLGFSLPKILYPIGDKTILDQLLNTFETLAQHIIIIASPSGKSPIEEHLAARSSITGVSIAVQPEPRGMADAILYARDIVTTPHALVVWGDQATVSERTCRLCMVAHEARLNAQLTFPTFMKTNPYIDVQREPSGRIKKILQKREGEITSTVGENDCGVFLFNSARLFALLSEHRQTNVARGANTKEFNLLPLLPLFDDGHGSAQTLRVSEESETLGVNTPEDGRAVAATLSSNSRAEI